jgi:N-glycosylase/DNA lyase
MRIQLGKSTPLNLDFTLCCGQTFRWDKKDGWWYGVVGEKVLKIRQKGNSLEFENAETDFVKSYFRLQDDLPKILFTISKDNHIRATISQLRGLRILRQDSWECLISYICATYKSIAAIKHMLLNLSEKFGEEERFDGCIFYTFPTPAKLAKATIKELEGCGLGYRARYVSETAKTVKDDRIDFERLKRQDYNTARTMLQELSGVGPKVADCVQLFALEKLQAFPVDVWMRRVILRHYQEHFPSEFLKRISDEKSLTNSEYARLNLFGSDYFGKYAGYAQEYLYHYERTHS